MKTQDILFVMVLSALVSIATVYGLRFMDNPREYIVVDVKKIIDEEQKFMGEKMRGSDNAQEMSRVYNDSVERINAIFNTIDAYAKENNIVIFQKGAVIGSGIKDYTDEFERKFSREK